MDNTEEAEDVEGNADGPSRKAPQILAINPKVIHRICSGQVIVTLSTAVKELVENSLDAGATSIDIRLSEFGSKMIEVCDNGSGVEESNLQALTLKHHTSKISDFGDLSTVETLGFRGEALSSLCAMATLTVVTKSQDSLYGYKVQYDSKGRIVEKGPCAREKGTTVFLANLFAPLPVRHKEFLRNLKREYNKMISVLYGYCLISKGIRINCTNQTENPKNSSKVLSIPALGTMKERIVTLFGPKVMETLLEMKQCDDRSISEEVLSEFGLSESLFSNPSLNKYSLEGFISAPNKGRSSNDRQFFWINSRPCEPMKISRLINEVYHGFSRNQNPFVCLHIRTNQSGVDVNVTPDKRTIYLQDEKVLCATVKALLLDLLSSASSDFSSSCQQMTALSHSSSTLFDDTPQSKSPSLFASFASQSSSKMSNSKTKCVFGRSASTNISSSSYNSRNKSSNSSGGRSISAKFPVSRKSMSNISANIAETSTNSNSDEDNDEEDEILDERMSSDEYEESPFFGNVNSSSQKENLDVECEDSDINSAQCREIIMYDDDFEDDFNPSQTNVSINVDWREILYKVSIAEISEEDKKVYSRKFRAKISPTENDCAEEELRKQISKEMFSKMEIIGQFNLGFVLVKSGPDLFIVDQHASDEKYNFENLEKTTILIGQVLIRPIDLQLPAISENVIIENLDIFQRNGFDFEIQAEGNPTERIKMTKIPFSKSIQFGKSDVEELIFMMEDCPEKTFCRPSRVRDMLASRACRKSVMVGTAMNLQQMRALVDNMGLINQPWNCPHGRPTIRHLLNLNLLPDIDSRVEFNHL